MGKAKTVALALKSGRSMDVPLVHRSGVWAVHNALDWVEDVLEDEFSVTHIPSGICAAWLLDRDEAIAVCDELGRKHARAMRRIPFGSGVCVHTAPPQLRKQLLAVKATIDTVLGSHEATT